MESNKIISRKKIGIIIQARTGSTRLPNKVLKKFYRDKGILEIIIDDLKRYFKDYPIVLATSTAAADEVFKEVALKHDIIFFQGSENNVLLRFIEASRKNDFTHIIRVCSDNPFLNMHALKSLATFSESDDFDYLSYSNHQGIPTIKTHIGLFAEMVSFKALVLANQLQDKSIYQEHVTNFIYEHPEMFNIKLLNSPEVVFYRDDIRLTLDDLDDFNNLSSLYSRVFEKKEDLEYLLKVIDSDDSVREKMVTNIKKYTK